MSILFASHLCRVFAVLLMKTFGKVTGGVETHFVGYFVDGLGGGLDEGVAALQAHLTEQLHGRQAGDGFHLSI